MKLSFSKVPGMRHRLASNNGIEFFSVYLYSADYRASGMVHQLNKSCVEIPGRAVERSGRLLWDLGARKK